MATIQFDESKFKLRSRRIIGDPEVPTLIRLLVTKGIVKNENQAIGILLGAVVLLIIMSVYVTKSSGAKPATLDQDYVQINTNLL